MGKDYRGEAERMEEELARLERWRDPAPQDGAERVERGEIVAEYRANLREAWALVRSSGVTWNRIARLQEHGAALWADVP